MRDRLGILFVIYYFGFAQPAIDRIAEQCLRRQFVLIEDCAHALFSRNAGHESGCFALIQIALEAEKRNADHRRAAASVVEPYLRAIRVPSFSW